MGHKINPLIFRSKLYPYYKNLWNNNNYCNFSSLKNYIYINRFFKKNKNLNIIYFKIDSYKKYYVFNFIVKSKMDYYLKQNIINSNILSFIKKNYPKNIKYTINYIYLLNPILCAHFITYYIVEKLKNYKLSIRKIIPHIVLLLNFKYNVKGIKFIISGRINGVQMAKSETFKFNKNSTQLKKSLVKYSCVSFVTKYGVLGIKLWLFLK